MLSALQTDFPDLAGASAADLMAAAERAFPSAPFVPASTYQGTGMSQEIDALWPSNYPARADRPVLMRGAKYRLHQKYAVSRSQSPNGWAAKVFWRWVRMQEITALTYDAWEDATSDFFGALHRKYFLTRGFAERAAVRFPRCAGKTQPISGGEVVVNGALGYADDVFAAMDLFRLHKELLRVERLMGRVE